MDFSGIEVMDEPVKSENDKKLYRVIRLPNGLKALLISDPTAGEATATDTEKPMHVDKSSASAAATSDEESETEDENDDDDDNESDAENDNDDENREKLSACSLCVDVGSFSDPRDVQGLAHFLGKRGVSVMNRRRFWKDGEVEMKRRVKLERMRVKQARGRMNLYNNDDAFGK